MKFSLTDKSSAASLGLSSSCRTEPYLKGGRTVTQTDRSLIPAHVLDQFIMFTVTANHAS